MVSKEIFKCDWIYVIFFHFLLAKYSNIACMFDSKFYTKPTKTTLNNTTSCSGDPGLVLAHINSLAAQLLANENVAAASGGYSQRIPLPTEGHMMRWAGNCFAIFYHHLPVFTPGFTSQCSPPWTPA